MSYRHLIEAGIRSGEPLDLCLQRVSPDSLEPVNINRNVEGFAGGGFYGSVILLGDLVVKTAQPAAFHELLRQMNWPVPFPSQSSDAAAKLDYISGRIIGDVIPRVTDQEVVVPRAEGYTKLPGGLGFGQAIERVYGRGPTFLDNGAENEKVRNARQRIWEAGVAFGLEAAAQVHPDNPFGKANIWLNDGQVIWLDYLPAFRHTGLVKPFFRYRFHEDVRQAFGSQVPTYNRVHTDVLRLALSANQEKFRPEDHSELSALANSYDAVREEYIWEQSQNPRSLFIKDALERELISPSHAERLNEHKYLYAAHRLRRIGGLGVRSVVDFANATPLKMLWSAEPWKDAKKFFTNRECFLGSTMLRGIKKAHQEGLVTDEELETTLDIISKKDLRFYTLFEAGYFATSRVVDAATVYLAIKATRSSHPAEWGWVPVFNTCTPGLIRATGTLILGKVLGRNLNKMALYSTIPVAGTYLAVPAQIQRDYGQREAKVMHYNLRSLAATLSKVRPYGGWGSDLEEKIWNTAKRSKAKKLELVSQLYKMIRN